MARLGGLDGEILVEGAHNAVCQACRVLMSRGIVGPFETWKESVPYACMRGDIESKRRTSPPPVLISISCGSHLSHPRLRSWEVPVPRRPLTEPVPLRPK